MCKLTKKSALISKTIILLAILNVIFNFLCFAEDNFLTDEEKFIYTTDDRPDPFMPLLGEEGQIKGAGVNRQKEMNEYLNKIKVNGVIWDDKMPLVMINNKIRKKGDIVENMTIEKITDNSVILTYYDLQHEIALIKRKKPYDQGGI